MWRFKRPEYAPTTLEVIRSNGAVDVLLPRFPVKVQFIKDKFNLGDTFHWTTGTLLGKTAHAGKVVARIHNINDDSYLIRLQQEY